MAMPSAIPVLPNRSRSQSTSINRLASISGCRAAMRSASSRNTRSLLSPCKAAMTSSGGRISVIFMSADRPSSIASASTLGLRRLGFDQAVVAVLAAIDDAQRFGGGILEEEEVVFLHLELRERLVHGHGFHGDPLRTDPAARTRPFLGEQGKHGGIVAALAVLGFRDLFFHLALHLGHGQVDGGVEIAGFLAGVDVQMICAQLDFRDVSVFQ